MKFRADLFLEKFLAKSDFDLPTNAQDSIRIITRLRAGNSRVTLIFVPWQSGRVMQSWIMKQVPKNRDVYSISPRSLLLKDPIQTKTQSLRVCEQSLEQVRKIVDSKKYEELDIAGLSIGTGVAVYVANRISTKINNIDLVCPGAKLSTALWLGSRTKSLRTKYEDQGFELEDIQRLWSQVDLINNLDFARKTSVRVTYSGADSVIVASQTEKVIEKLKDLKPPKLKIRRNRTKGHYLTMFSTWLNWRTIYRSGKIR
ncbi:MAG: Peptidase protein [Patescibacteria group bacterium]|nr:Peptidase protein [Patescibacteria group bacterium]